ncbi:hypothetical protein [Massilia sp. PWRC2]|uniref:hypothetical protein n=1 Tax=Massilia sp. PWRC2 TaxID=2804626 RepID=UPI003CF24965
MIALTRQGQRQVKAAQSARTDYLAQLLAARLSAEEKLLRQAPGLLDSLSDAEGRRG